MEVDNNINEINSMPASSTISMIIAKNFSYLLVLLFYPAMDFIIQVMPDWKNNLDNFKLIGGAVIVVLVIAKLVLEIFKLVKK